MFKWLCLILSMGCVANATNLSKKVNKDDDNKDTDFPEIRTIKNEIRWSKKEQLYWLLGGITFIFLFLIL
ncbi:hypothetical protein ABVB09_00345 [Streptococcus dysgalactiae subsp. equisimilis]|uniref:Phage protein n=2 Tax=Streptococcus dysgalactiae TaxID=1334 RepID=A0A9X8XIU8_STREQ|nr:hypothetical protein [Streptococcus dysgalactiae]ADX23592.1 hypothetical protein SDE12394_00180 [Streptococcus dysgalactiae subsp. equisimilis ATCC 12394]KKC16619.1 hypothetical protein WH81_08315 [Streptococcus dysgalactiae subsp. equisimilis]KKC22017.1 hypothetical protein WH79_09020 [Streptococcus dysgalactiae subsp. equisimilis]MBM6514516.1 hypothetical protein [Streptococcus dysgalactiae subsp. equisimilis]MBM6534344.1 hypothetical protein [Streptococcus dysgalactiae subsp. equisimilis